MTEDKTVAPAQLVAIIDDDCDICISLKGLLRSYGYKAEYFESAEAFLDSGKLKDTACVISDVQMPGGMSGFDLASQITASGSGLQVILISAFADEGAQKAAKKAGARALLKKPFDACVLVEHLGQALGLTKAAATACGSAVSRDPVQS